MKEFYLEYKRIIHTAVIVVLILLIYIFTVNTDEFMQNEGPKSKKVEIENMTVSGYKKGKLSWLIKSRYVWSSYSLDHANVEDIYDGTLFDNGKVVLKDLEARSVRTNAPKERLTASGGVRASLIRHVKQERHIVALWTENLSYFSNDQRSYLTKAVKLRDKDILISSDKAEIDHETNEVQIGKDFTITKELSRISGDSLLMKIDSEDFLAKGNITLLRKGDQQSGEEFKKEDTEITCDELNMKITDDLAQAELIGNIKIWQKDKQGWAKNAFFNEAEELLTLKNEAVLIFEKSDWLLDQKTIDKIKNKEVQESIYEKLTLYGDLIAISTKSKDFQAQGNVKVLLKDKEAVAEKAEYDKDKEVITLLNNVMMKDKDGSWVKAGVIKVLVAEEEFAAAEEVETTVYLKR